MDALNAFTGILREAWLSEDPTYHFWGLPFSSDAGKTKFWGARGVPASSDAGKTNAIDSQFVQALLWKPKTHSPNHTVTRRSFFPLWRWAGWKGLSGFAARDWVDESSHKDGRVSISTKEGESLTLETNINRMDKCWYIGLFDSVLRLTGWVTSARIVDWRSYPASTYDKVADTTGCAFAYAHITDSALLALPSFFTSVWPVILFFAPSKTPDETKANGLLIRQMDNSTYERIGTFFGNVKGSASELGGRATLKVRSLDRKSFATLQCDRKTIRLA